MIHGVVEGPRRTCPGGKLMDFPDAAKPRNLAAALRCPGGLGKAGIPFKRSI
jgi:hypothetical protein